MVFDSNFDSGNLAKVEAAGGENTVYHSIVQHTYQPRCSPHTTRAYTKGMVLLQCHWNTTQSAHHILYPYE